MGANFGRNYPVLAGTRRADDRERLFFFAAAGLAAFLFFTVLAVLNFKDRAVARDEIAPVAANAQPAAIGTVTLLAPERRVRAGQKLSEVSFKQSYWPRAQVPPDAIRDAAELKNAYAKMDIPEGMPIQKTHLSDQPILATLPLTPGNRAISIEIDATAGIEGWALPGSFVDVVLTGMREGELSSRILVQNARVLSLGGDMRAERDERLRGGLRDIKKTITLDVSAEDALRIATGREMGRLSLMMRVDNNPLAITELIADKISPTDDKKPAKPGCKKGTIKSGDHEFTLNCDGSMELIEAFEP